ncbi:MAG: molybdenum cofactor synthesis domain-containing protein [Bacteroidota bacterium]
MDIPQKISILVITLSDRASEGIYEDLSGPMIISMLEKHWMKLKRQIEIEHIIIPDSEADLISILSNERENRNIMITTGGTGIGTNDITVDVVKPMLDKEIPGIMELIRVKYGMKKPNAVLSRGVAGIIGKSLIYTLPGSVKAVTEYMSEILKTMEHLIYMQYGVDVHCKKGKNESDKTSKCEKRRS